MVYKIGLLGFFILIAINLHAFQHSKSVMKKVHTEIVASFDVEQFELNELIISDVVNANLKQVQVQDDLLKIDIERARTLASLAYLYLPTHAHFSNKE